jgi:E3 SUMO-protein ligase PIAS1
MSAYQLLTLGRYVNDILQSTPKSVDQVVIEPDGKWSQNALPISPRRTNSSQLQNSGGDDVDDDIIEIQDVRLASLKTEYASTPTSGPKTPSSNSRELSTSRSSTNKRPVIDLTLSDDDDGPQRPAKRAMNSDALTNNALERRNGYRTHTSSSRLNGLSFQMPAGNSRSNPTSIGTPDR